MLYEVMEEVIEAAVLAGRQEGGRGIEGEGLREGEMRERVKQAERQHIKKAARLDRVHHGWLHCRASYPCRHNAVSMSFTNSLTGPKITATESEG